MRYWKVANAGRAQPAPKGASDFEELLVSLKRYPDTRRSSAAACAFARRCEYHIGLKTRKLKRRGCTGCQPGPACPSFRGSLQSRNSGLIGWIPARRLPIWKDLTTLVEHRGRDPTGPETLAFPSPRLRRHPLRED